mmetsp:Transcript_20977/g.72377  ORF Transcript_20977/g.72377 Transcript_20977/m.72377 type:complete len:83 (+) Transcript_20977:414-662(+)
MMPGRYQADITSDASLHDLGWYRDMHLPFKMLSGQATPLTREDLERLRKDCFCERVDEATPLPHFAASVRKGFCLIRSRLFR